MLLIVPSCGTPSAPSTGGTQLPVNATRDALFGTGEDQAANYRLVEEEIQRCMLQKGFEYTPDRRAASDRSSLPFPTIGSWETELAEQFGFGIAQFPNVDFIPSYEQVSRLSPTQQQAWNEAHLGPGGCRETATAAVNAARRAKVLPLIKDFEELEQAFQADHRTLRLNLDWSTCMAQLGYDEGLGSLQEFAATFAQTYNKFIADVGTPEFTDEQALVLDELIERERAAAVDAASCAAPLQAEHLAIWNEYQSDFLSGADIPPVPGSSGDEPS